MIRWLSAIRSVYYVCASIKVISVKQNGKSNLTLKCADAQTAQEAERLLKTKYANAIDVRGVKPFIPQTKVTCLYTDLTEADDIKAQIIGQND